MTQRLKQGSIVVLTTVVLIGSTIIWTFADQIREPVTKQIEYRTLVLSSPLPQPCCKANWKNMGVKAGNSLR